MYNGLADADSFTNFSFLVKDDINAKIKVFKIMSHPYRNRRESHLARTKLICAILNAEWAWGAADKA